MFANTPQGQEQFKQFNELYENSFYLEQVPQMCSETLNYILENKTRLKELNEYMSSVFFFQEAFSPNTPFSFSTLKEALQFMELYDQYSDPDSTLNENELTYK